MNTEGVLTMDIEERTINIGHYIIDKKATVRAAAKFFGVSKSTVHTVRSICVGCIGTSQCIDKQT